MSNADYIPPTLDELLERRWVSGEQRAFFEAVADCKRDGIRIGTLAFEPRSKRLHETRASQKHSELLLAAHALVAVGLQDFDLSPGERPDFQLRLGSEHVGLEVAELVEPESARISNSAENIRIGIRERLDADRILREALGDRLISLSAWECPKRSLERKIVDEYERLIRTRLPQMVGPRIQDGTYPAMTACLVHAQFSELQGGSVDFTPPPTAFNPHALVPVATKVLERKRKKAASYAGDRLWLVMTVTDVQGIFDASVDTLGGILPDIAPFELVVIRGSQRVAVWVPDKHMSVAI